MIIRPDLTLEELTQAQADLARIGEMLEAFARDLNEFQARAQRREERDLRLREIDAQRRALEAERAMIARAQ